MSITVTDSAGVARTVETLPTVGAAAKSASLPVALATDTFGQANKVNSLPVVLASDSDPLSTIANSFAKVATSSTLQRLANTTAYAAGQLIGGSATAGFTNNGFSFTSVSRVAGGYVQINRARLYKSNPTALGSFELSIFRAQPTLTIGDAGTFSSGVPVGNATANARLVGRFTFDMTTGVVGSDGVELGALSNTNSPILVSLPGGQSDLFGVLKSLGAYTPASGETFSVALECFTF